MFGRVVKTIIFSLCFSSVAFAHGWGHRHFGYGYQPYGGAYMPPPAAVYYPPVPIPVPQTYYVQPPVNFGYVMPIPVPVVPVPVQPFQRRYW